MWPLTKKFGDPVLRSNIIDCFVYITIVKVDNSNIRSEPPDILPLAPQRTVKATCSSF